MDLPWTKIIAGIIITVIGGFILNTLMDGLKRRAARKAERNNEIRTALRALPPILHWAYSQLESPLKTHGNLNPQILEIFDGRIESLRVDLPEYIVNELRTFRMTLESMITDIEATMGKDERLTLSKDGEERTAFLIPLYNRKFLVNIYVESYLDK
ncbi:MAG: hypothetical protein IIA59_00525 [Candidatus Marinimicrobia bacterium]|nr:hypothetical protein [Candidatus Neomarinimicrobiota bacterium]